MFQGNGKADAAFFTLINNDDFRNTFNTENYKIQFGLAATKYQPNSVFAYHDISIPDVENESSEETQKRAGKIFHYYSTCVEGFTALSWLIKDNSIGIFDSVCETTGKINFIQRLSGRVNTRNCKGEKEPVEFTAIDLIELAALTIKYSEICAPNPTDLPEKFEEYEKDSEGIAFRTVLSGLPKSFNYHKTNCIERSMHFLATARMQENLIYKIAYYMPIFECLFSTESGEITTKLSYRIAFYIGSNKEERKEIRKTIYEAYNVRSKFLHGQLFNSKDDIEDETFLKMSIRIDEILRRVLNKVIKEDSANFLAVKQTRDEFLSNLIFN